MMKKATIVWLIVAASLVLAGCMIFFGDVMMSLGWDFSKLTTDKYETTKHEITEEYTDVTIVTDTADVVILPSDGEKCTVVCYEPENAKHSVTVKDGVLTVELQDTRKWYEHIGISVMSAKVTVYLPKGSHGALHIKSSTGDVEIPKDFEFDVIDVIASTGDVACYASATGDVRIKTSTGDVCVEGISADALDLAVSTGKVTVSDAECRGDVRIKVSSGKTTVSEVRCKSLTSTGNTGDIQLAQVIAEEMISIERSTGDVRLDACDAAELLLVTDTGDVTGTLLSDKVFIYKTDTGDVDLPRTQSGGRCDITTDTGDIRINVRS